MNPITLPAPGFHYGVPYEDYARWPAINFSRLKSIRKTASKCRYDIDHPKSATPAMVLGSSLHVATLEPALFEKQFFIRPECDRRTKEGKEIYAKALQEAAGRMMLDDGDDITIVRNMAAAIHASKAAKPFLQAEGQNEVSALWQDRETGLWCKARLDRFIPLFNLLGIPVIVEIKTTRDADEWSFGKDCHTMGYAAQAGCYRTAVKSITGKDAAHVFIAVENTPPHDLRVHMLDDQSLQTGLLQYREMLSRYAECEKSGNWPGYEDKVNILSLPKYAHEN